MKTYDVSGAEVRGGIAVLNKPYPHVVLGEGGNKRATWVALGKRDADAIVREGKVADVGVIALKDESGKPNGKFLIVAPKNGGDNRALVLWRVASGYRGSASISAGEGVIVIASDQSYHSGQGSLGSTAEVLAVLKPGQELTAHRSGRRVGTTRARLTWDGKTVQVEFGDESLFAALDEEVEGEYL